MADDDQLMAAAKMAEETDKKLSEDAGETPPSKEEPSEPSKAETPSEPAGNDATSEADGGEAPKKAEESSTSPEAAPETPSEETPAETPKAEATAEETRSTRKERRAERKESFIERIRNKEAQPNQPTPPPDYQPLDYNKLPENEEGFDPTDLSNDREKYAEAKAKQAEAAAEFRNQQDGFWKNVTYDHKLLTANPEFSYLDEESDDFDPDRTADFNERFLAIAGLTTIPRRDAEGRQLVDQQGNPIVDRVVRDSSLSYGEFIKEEHARLKKYADDAVAETQKNLAAQSAKTGLRPSGTRKGPQIASPADIRNMSPEEFEKNREAIDRHAQQLLQE